MKQVKLKQKFFVEFKKFAKSSKKKFIEIIVNKEFPFENIG